MGGPNGPPICVSAAAILETAMTDPKLRQPLRPSRPRLAWIPAFLAELEKGGVVRQALKAAGITAPTAYSARESHADFAGRWEQALATARDNGTPVPTICRAIPPQVPPAEPARPASAHWRVRFFEALSETSNVRAAATRACVDIRLVYKLRREDPAFTAKWQAALHEGYDNLEMELLGHLRNPQPGRRMDVPSALRLLGSHRATVERRRALDAEDDEQAVLESIDQFIEDMRQRRIANSAIDAERPDNDNAAD